MKKIISIDGSKGGVGKSIVSSAFIDTARSLGKEVLLIEGDTNNPDLDKSYGKIIRSVPICLDNANGINKFGETVGACDEEIIVINNPARANGWGEHGQIYIEMLPEIDATFTTIWVASGNPDCFEKFVDYVEAFPSVKKVICKNMHYKEEFPFDDWNSSDLRAQYLASGIDELSFPAIATRFTSYMRKERKVWEEFVLKQEEFGYVCEAQKARRIFHELLTPYII